MAIIFGWGGGSFKDQGAAVPVECPNCHNETFYRYVRSTKWFRLYFIPLIPYDMRHLLVCPVCTAGFEIHGQQREHARRMVGVTSQWQAGLLDDARYLDAVRAFHAGRSPAELPGRPTAPPSVTQHLPTSPAAQARPPSVPKQLPKSAAARAPNLRPPPPAYPPTGIREGTHQVAKGARCGIGWEVSTAGRRSFTISEASPIPAMGFQVSRRFTLDADGWAQAWAVFAKKDRVAAESYLGEQ